MFSIRRAAPRFLRYAQDDKPGLLKYARPRLGGNGAKKTEPTGARVRGEGNFFGDIARRFVIPDMIVRRDCPM